MTESLVIIGAGGFGREVLDIVDAINAQSQTPRWQVLGVVDDAPAPINLERLAARGVEFLGGTEVPVGWTTPVFYALGIGNPKVRRILAERYDAAQLKAATLVHPSVTTGFGVEVGPGAVICAGVRLTTNIRIGRHVHLNLNVTVGHDTALGDFVSINPLASISGDCVIESEVLVGVAGVVLNGLTVGIGSTVGGSACVVRDVPAGVTVKGVPAK